MDIGVKDIMVNPNGLLKCILGKFSSYLYGLKGRYRLRCEYLKIREYFKSTADCWQEQENKLLEEIEKGTVEGW
ncbi:MAG: hypothetical protein WBI44_06335 [Syntrophaceticus sp.]